MPKKEKKLKFAKILKISLDNVLNIGEEIQYRLMANKKSFEEIEKVKKIIKKPINQSS